MKRIIRTEQLLSFKSFLNQCLILYPFWLLSIVALNITLEGQLLSLNELKVSQDKPKPLLGTRIF